MKRDRAAGASMTDEPSKPKIQWHQIFAHSLKLALTPVNIDVLSEVEVMARPPRADILLLRSKAERWTQRQRARLPDKIRDHPAGHVLIEFKYDETLNERVFQKAAGYDAFYKESNHLTDDKVGTYIVMSNTPGTDILERNGYREDRWRGVMVSDRDILRRMPVLLLNELALTPHNLAFKLFASRIEQKKQVIREIQEKPEWVDGPYENMVSGLYWYWFEEDIMATAELTAEKVMEMGEIFGKRYLELLPPEKRVEGLPARDRIAGLSDEEIFEVIPPKDLLAKLRSHLAELSDEDIKELRAMFQEDKNGSN
jgi:hypothetical protein